MKRKLPNEAWLLAALINIVLIAFFLVTHHPEKAAPQVVCLMLCAIPIGRDILSK